jgi:3-isopropylmalate/(R)-2-methylmalate dehydratase small subunit
MEPFVNHTGIIATLDRSNVDTDAIIPKQFLKSIKRTGYGPSLFFDWRYLPDGSPDPAFELNQPRFAGRSILVTRNNFGCGSSREHAVWALLQDGFRVVVAPWKEIGGQHLPAFADIFGNNSVKNGLLAVELSEPEVEAIFDHVTTHPGAQMSVDLARQQVTLPADPTLRFTFKIDPGAKEQLLKGLDEISLTLQYEAQITRFEQAHP